MSEDSRVGPLSQRVPGAANRPTPSMRIAPPVLPESLLERLRAEKGTSREEQAGPGQSGSAKPPAATPEGEPGRADAPRRLAWARRRDRTSELDRTSHSDRPSQPERAVVNVVTAAAAGLKQAELHTLPATPAPNPLRRRTPADANVPKLPMRPAVTTAPHTAAVFEPGPEPGATTQPIPVIPVAARNENVSPVGKLRVQPERMTQPERTVQPDPRTQPGVKTQPVRRTQPDPSTQPDARTQQDRAAVSIVTAAASGLKRAEMQTLTSPPVTSAAPPRRTPATAEQAEAPTQALRPAILPAVVVDPGPGAATQPIPAVAGALTQPIPVFPGPGGSETVRPAADVPRVRADRISLPGRSVERDTGPDGRTQPELPPQAVPESAVPLDHKAATDLKTATDQEAAPDHRPSSTRPNQAGRGQRPAVKRPLASVPTGSAAPRVNPELMMRPLFADSETLEEVIVSLRDQAARRNSPAARRYRVIGVVISVLVLVAVIVLIV